MIHPRRRRNARRHATAALLTAILLMTSGCVDSAHDDARDSVTAHIEQVAIDATEWAQQDQASGSPSGTRDVLDRVVATVHANARELSSDVRNSDPEGTGSLGEVRLVLEGTGSGWLWSQAEALYIFCARFELTRSPGQPRIVSAELFDCPPGAVPSGWRPTAPTTPVATPS
ncbi:hypothetical protein [Micromonospora sp. NPDC049891]|uniref:hypothetical protein n=1 Tax=Micromonospora sp. NPDC049891 TaxID=3155655 RepID=UPI00340F6CE0